MTETVRHTLGPWIAGTVLVEGLEPEDEAIVYAGGDADSGAATEIVIKGENAVGCAILIVAATDMLAALNAIDAVGVLNPTGSRAVEEATRSIKTAIAKAEGRQP
ncbi:hypothetical protein LB517_27940 [Mesorhizobium sp. BR1-1-12]|uniref:hypothetical protein n=1 Tax=Mesorhizobium sp. BR1-1-12 TaxID=2876657 RepID=UPI001CD171ED|nr:hypothetical protein [Mesorhizobium sp. BR1-1-12]MBZ9973465.1 hypothetical protein [Mesorhizobium sp. BR1-1-12]